MTVEVTKLIVVVVARLVMAENACSMGRASGRNDRGQWVGNWNVAIAVIIDLGKEPGGGGWWRRLTKKLAFEPALSEATSMRGAAMASIVMVRVERVLVMEGGDVVVGVVDEEVESTLVYGVRIVLLGVVVG